MICAAAAAGIFRSEGGKQAFAASAPGELYMTGADIRGFAINSQQINHLALDLPELHCAG